MVNSKKGIAMIELIFALVIIGIVLMSAPMLIQQSIRSGNVAMQQEAIAVAASQASVILSMHWDENNNSNSAGTSRILDANRAPFDFDTINAPAGLIGVDGRTHESSAGLTLPVTQPADFGRDETNSTDTNESSFDDFDDVDDYDNSTFGLAVFNGETTTADVGDYVDVNLTMNIQISYAEDRVNTGAAAALTGTTIALNNNINNISMAIATNIKFIRVNLTSNSGVAQLDKNITFEAFSSNIGTSFPQGDDHI